MKKTRRLISMLLTFVMLASAGTVSAGSEKSDKVRGFRIVSSGSDSWAVHDALYHDGKSSLKMVNKSDVGNNVYLMAESDPIPVTQGKTYRYGFWAKSTGVTYATVRLSWGNSRSTVPSTAQKFDWTHFEFEYTHNSDSSEITMQIILDGKTEGYYIDSVFFKEKGTSKNLVGNGSFEESDSDSVTVTGSTQTADNGFINAEIENSYNEIKSSTEFNADEMRKYIGGFKHMPVYKNESIAVDGSLDDWENYSEIRMPTLSRQYQVYINDGAERDLNGFCKYAYDDDRFYIALKVADDIAVTGGYSYWECDSIQLALSQFGEGYGMEMSFVPGDTDGRGSVYCDSIAQDNIKNIEFYAKRENGETIYEISIPWILKFDKRPEMFLFDLLINDNDGAGRRYCVELAPGISEGKSNAQFPCLQTMETKNDWYAWIEGERNPTEGDSYTYDLYFVNRGDRKVININGETIEVKANTGIRREIKKVFDTEGKTSVDAEITLDKKVYTISYDAAVSRRLPTETEFNNCLAEADMYAKNIKSLLDKCSARGISTDYETINYTVINRFCDYLRQDKENNDLTRVWYTADCLKKLHDEAQASLNAYLSGTKTPLAVPKYVSEKTEIDGKTIIGTTELNGETQRRPVFFTGYGHFDQVRSDIENLGFFGANAMQQEIGPYDVIYAPGGADKWYDVSYGGAQGSFSLTSDETYSGNSCLKLIRTTPEQPNVYLGMYQKVDVKPNTVYEFGCYAKANNANGIWMSANGFSDRQGISGTYDWKKLRFTYKTGAQDTEKSVYIVCDGITDELYIDDFYFREVGTEENLIQNSSFEDKESGTTDEFSVRTYKQLQVMLNVLERAQDSNVAVSLLLSPHYFPSFLKEKYPEIRCSTGWPFLTYDIYSPIAKQAEEAFLRAVIPIIKDYKSLNNLVISNEPAYNIGLVADTLEDGSWYVEQWQTYLKQLYDNDISKLNTRYKSSYASFEEVKMPTAVEATPLFYDFKYLTDEMCSQWHEWMSGIIREIAPEIPLSTKVIGYLPVKETYGTRRFLGYGTKQENMLKYSDMCGNDCYNTLEESKTQPLAKNIWYDFQTSLKEAPIINSEDHIINDRDTNFEPMQADYSAADLFQGSIHGRGFSAIWLWQRSYGHLSDAWGSVLFRPDCIAKIGYAACDLNRLSYEIQALQNAHANVAVLYSEPTRIYNLDFIHAIYQAYAAASYSGQRVRFVTEDYMDKLQECKMLVLPDITNIKASTLEKIEEFQRCGGKVIVLGENTLEFDEYNNSHDVGRITKIKENADVIKTEFKDNELVTPSITDLQQIMREKVHSAGLDYINIYDADTGKPADNVEFSYAEYNGKTVINICNYEMYTTKKLYITIDGKKVAKSQELRQAVTNSEIFEAKSFRPLIITVEKSE